MSPKKLKITSESEFREQTGLTEPVTLEWEEGKVVEATQGALDGLKKSMDGKKAEQQRKLAEEFISANEKKDAIDTLTDKLGGNILKNPAVLATAGTVATGVGVAVHALDKKFEETTGEKGGFMDSIRDWLKETADESSGFMKSILMMLYSAMGGKKEKEEEKNEESEGKTETEKTDAHLNNTVIKATAVILAKLSPALLHKTDLYKDQKNVAIILTMPQILSVKYEDLEKKFKKFSHDKSEGIGKELGVNSYKDQEIYNAIYLIFADEKLFASLFAPKKGDTSWKSKSIAELFQIISRDIKVFDRMTNAAKSASTGEFQKLLGSEDESEGTQFDGRVFTGDMKEKIDMMMSQYKDKGLTLKVATDIMTNPDSLNTQAMKEREYTEAEIGFVEYLKGYTKTIASIVSSDNYGGSDSTIAEILQKNPLTLKESFRFFMITADAKSIDEMNVFAQYKLYGFTRSLINVRNSESGLAGYDSFMFRETKNVVTNSPSKLPLGVQNLLKQMTDGAKKMAENWLEENLRYGWELIKKNPQLGIVAIGMVAGTFLLGRVVFAGKVAGIAVLTVIGALAATMGLGSLSKNLESEKQKIN